MKKRIKSNGPATFHVVVDAADRLSVEEQEALIQVLDRRLAERRRRELAAEIEEAEREFAHGTLHPTTAKEIIKEILS